MKDANPPRNKTAIVTGASQGIGATIADHLRMVGFRIGNVDIAPPPARKSPTRQYQR